MIQRSNRSHSAKLGGEEDVLNKGNFKRQDWTSQKRDNKGNVAGANMGSTLCSSEGGLAWTQETEPNPEQKTQ